MAGRARIGIDGLVVENEVGPLAFHAGIRDEHIEGVCTCSLVIGEGDAEGEHISAVGEQLAASANEMVTVIDGVGAISEQNKSAAQQMQESGQEVGRAIEGVAGIAEQNSAATQQVSASAEEMGAQVEEIIVSSNSLKQMAAALQESVSVFKINELIDMETLEKELGIEA